MSFKTHLQIFQISRFFKFLIIIFDVMQLIIMQYTCYMIDVIVWTNIAKYKLNALFVDYGHIVCMMNAYRAKKRIILFNFSL